MLHKIIRTRKFLGIFISFCLLISAVIYGQHWFQNREKNLEEKHLILLKYTLNKMFRENGDWPDEVSIDERAYQVQYTFNLALTEHIKKMLNQYRSDYSTVIVIDNNNGDILSAVGYQRQGNRFNPALPFSSTHPSASLIKIVTAADLLKRASVDLHTLFSFAGRSTTLFRYQLRDTWNRWSRYQTLKDAFAKSNNVVFGKAAINYLNGSSIYQMANDFGFNQDLMEEITLSKSIFPMPSDQYHLAELASGYNDQTLMSPIHAALLASVVANGGILIYPGVISRLIDKKTRGEWWGRSPKNKRVLDSRTSSELQELMHSTIENGTARGSFRRMAHAFKANLSIGGKTGSITGGAPFGKRDWFTVYAVPTDSKLGKGISISVMNVNVNKWFVRSAYLAKSIIEFYFEDMFSTNNNIGRLKKNRQDNKTNV
jgi:penicillin-binding protein A